MKDFFLLLFFLRQQFAKICEIIHKYSIIFIVKNLHKFKISSNWVFLQKKTKLTPGQLGNKKIIWIFCNTEVRKTQKKIPLIIKILKKIYLFIFSRFWHCVFIFFIIFFVDVIVSFVYRTKKKMERSSHDLELIYFLILLLFKIYKLKINKQNFESSCNRFYCLVKFK